MPHKAALWPEHIASADPCNGCDRRACRL